MQPHYKQTVAQDKKISQAKQECDRISVYLSYYNHFLNARKLKSFIVIFYFFLQNLKHQNMIKLLKKITIHINKI